MEVSSLNIHGVTDRGIKFETDMFQVIEAQNIFKITVTDIPEPVLTEDLLQKHAKALGGVTEFDDLGDGAWSFALARPADLTEMAGFIQAIFNEAEWRK